MKARNQLLRVLAHHLVFVGKRAQILEPGSSELQIIENASSHWKRRATFKWTEMPGSITPHHSSSPSLDGPLATESGCHYHLSRTHTVGESCRSVGGFGTCIRDLNLQYSDSGPSPMDRLLADLEGLSLQPTIQSLLSNAAEFDPPCFGRSGCGCILISDSIISCFESPSEHTVSSDQCHFCQNAWSSCETSIVTDLLQPCTSSWYNDSVTSDEWNGATFTVERWDAVSVSDTHDSLPASGAWKNPYTEEINNIGLDTSPNVWSWTGSAFGPLDEFENGLLSGNLLV